MEQDFLLILPEILLSAFAMTALMIGAYFGQDRLARPILYATAIVLVLAGVVILSGNAPSARAWGGMFVNDAFARLAKGIILLSAAAILVMSEGYMDRRGLLRFEYPLLITLAAVGMMVMVSSGNLLVLYMGLELQSLSLYVVASLRRDSVKSTEAGLKYFVLGALSSGLLLYGASLVYGYTGTTQFAGILDAARGETSLGLLFGLVFVMAGLAFKVSAAPFHMWTPDVYEGAPTPITAFFATAPKVAAMALFARVLHDAFGGVVGDWQQILAFLSVVSMFLGGIAAIGQRNIKRLMAYSSISHMGYALMGLAAGTALGVEAMLVYMGLYVVMNIGTFAFILAMERDGAPVTEINALSQYSKVDPLKALCLLILMFSLAGVPPSIGFFAKYSVLLAAVDANLGWLAIAGVIAAVINAFYYLRIVFLMYFGEAEPGVDAGGSPMLSGFLIASALIMVFGLINFFGFDHMAEAAAATLVN